jgi:hypothetical protein
MAEPAVAMTTLVVPVEVQTVTAVTVELQELST